MPQSSATTPEEYLAELPEDRREVVATMRDIILRNLPDGYREVVGFGMLSYGIPLERYPGTYNKQPLPYAALAAQKNHYALYLMGAYSDPAHAAWLADEFAKAGKKLDMGKSCLRFRRLEDLPLDVVARSIASTPPERLIEFYEATRK
ncbi:MAG TPA: DUF1801 domain-containing protein [Longimicrobium sp.]|jgi:hypothetical protein